MYFFGYDFTVDAPNYNAPALGSTNWLNPTYAFDKNTTTQATTTSTGGAYLNLTWTTNPSHPLLYPAIRTLYLYNTNIPIDAIKVQYRNTASSYIIVPFVAKFKSQNNKHIVLFWDLQGETDLQATAKEFIIEVARTTEIYYISEIQIFDFLGYLNTSEDVNTRYTRAQYLYTNSDNKNIILFKNGTGLDINLNFKAHMDADVALLDTLYARNDSFYIWLNSGKDSIIKQKISPWKFEDIIKVSMLKKRKPEFHKNLIFSGFNDTISLVKVE